MSTPVRSKERLVFHCGVRRFSAAPVFSLHTVGDKHKVYRSLYSVYCCEVLWESELKIVYAYVLLCVCVRSMWKVYY